MNRYLPCCITTYPDLWAGAACAAGGDGSSLVLVVLVRRVLAGRVGEALDLLNGFGRGDTAGHHLAEARHTDLLLLQLDVPVLQARIEHIVPGQLQRRYTGLQARGQGDP